MYKTVAFFDVDNTVVNITTLVSFMKFYHHAEGRPDEYVRRYSTLESMKLNGASRQKLNELYYQQFKGANFSDMMNIGRRWFNSLNHKTLFNTSVINAINEHKQKGNSIALVSGSFQPCLAPILEHIGGHCLLCTDLEIVENVMTGNIKQQAIGVGKRNIIQRFASEQALQLANCYAYGDDVSDVDMMTSVGYPVAVASRDSTLVDIAHSRGWPVI